MFRTHSALRLIGYLLHDEDSLKQLNQEYMDDLLEVIISVIQNSSDKISCNLAIWCISVQSLNPSILKVKLRQLAQILAEILSSQRVKSSTIHYEALNAIAHLLDQDSEGMKDYIQDWGIASFQLLVTGSLKVRSRAEQLLYNKTLILLLCESENNQQFGERMAQIIDQDFIADLNRIVNSPNMELFVIHAWAYIVLLLNCRLMTHPVALQPLLHIAEHYFRHERAQIRSAMLQKWTVMAYALSSSPSNFRKKKNIKLLMTPLYLTMHKDRSLRVKKVCIQTWHYILVLLEVHHLSVDDIFSSSIAPVISIMLNSSENVIWMYAYDMLRDALENSSPTRNECEVSIVAGISSFFLSKIKPIVFTTITERTLPPIAIYRLHRAYESNIYKSLETLLSPLFDINPQAWSLNMRESLQKAHISKFRSIWSLLVDHALCDQKVLQQSQEAANITSLFRVSPSSSWLNSLVHFFTSKAFTTTIHKFDLDTGDSRDHNCNAPSFESDHSPIQLILLELLLEKLLISVDKRLLSELVYEESWSIDPCNSNPSRSTEKLRQCLFKTWLCSPFDGSYRASNLHLLNVFDDTFCNINERISALLFAIKSIQLRPLAQYHRLLFWKTIADRLVVLLESIQQSVTTLQPEKELMNFEILLLQGMIDTLIWYLKCSFSNNLDVELCRAMIAPHEMPFFEVYNRTLEVMQHYLLFNCRDDLMMIYQQSFHMLFITLEQEIAIAPLRVDNMQLCRLVSCLKPIYDSLVGSKEKEKIVHHDTIIAIAPICARLLQVTYNGWPHISEEWSDKKYEILRFLLEVAEQIAIIPCLTTISAAHRCIVVESLAEWLHHTDESLREMLNYFWSNLVLKWTTLDSLDSSILELLWPLLEAAFQSPFREIQKITIRFWNASFGKCSTLLYPEVCLPVLQRLKEVISHITIDDNSNANSNMHNSEWTLSLPNWHENHMMLSHQKSSVAAEINTPLYNDTLLSTTAVSMNTPSSSPLSSIQKTSVLTINNSSEEKKESGNTVKKAIIIHGIADNPPLSSSKFPNRSRSSTSPLVSPSSSPQGILAKERWDHSTTASRTDSRRVSFNLPESDEEKSNDHEDPIKAHDSNSEKAGISSFQSGNVNSQLYKFPDEDQKQVTCPSSALLEMQCCDEESSSQLIKQQTTTHQSVNVVTNDEAVKVITLGYSKENGSDIGPNITKMTTVLHTHLSMLQADILGTSSSPCDMSQISTSDWLHVQQHLAQLLLAINNHLNIRLSS
jgi:hypothetical protein